MRLSRVDRPTRTGMALSGDGRFVVYSAIKENPTPRDQPCLYLRRLDQLEGKPIAGTEGGSSPFLSPDDRWIGFWADGKLKKVSVDGGVALGLCDVPLLLASLGAPTTRSLSGTDPRVDSLGSQLKAVSPRP
ncbi:MAG: hypothetical protein EHM61_06910 [Acidobacteria bacterium]|nr:MAG: hypothetical protein EHM61_06910 [Acidobacteriota bacterium]